MAVSLLVAFQSVGLGQGLPEPERSHLLNGLRVVLLPRPGEPDVLVKLRIHSGGAFDLAGKAGNMALLGDLLFPDPGTREYFTDEMKGRLNVTTDYDSMTVTMQGRSTDFERMIEILRTAMVTPQVTPENVAKAREGRIKVIRETSISPAFVADRAIATRLFGEFPYGRPYAGTVESLERVDRSDLLLARERFLNSNNATVVVIGGVQSSRAMRVLRQLLGVWRRSEQVIPATFRQPQPPDSRALVINAPADQSVEIRLATRGLARRDPDIAAATLLGIVIRQRWEKLLPELSRSPVFVRHDAFALPGMFVMGSTVDSLLAGKTLATAQEVIKSVMNFPVVATELEEARSESLTAINNDLARRDGVAQAWLDMDTYGLPPVAERIRALKIVSPNDLQQTATRLFREGVFASIVLGNAELVKTQIGPYIKLELLGEINHKTGTAPKIRSGSNTLTQPKASAKPE